MLTGALQRVVRSRINPRPVALLRALLGVLVGLRGIYFIEQVRAAHAEDLFTVAGTTLPGSVVSVALVGLWFGLGAALVLGWRSRWAAGGYALLVAALLAADPLFFNNHLYLMGLVAALLACTDCGAAWALDARRPDPVATVAGWPVFLLQAQVSITYAFAALSKTQEDFVSGLSLHTHLSQGPFAPLLPAGIVDSFAVLAAVAVTVIAVQATLVWALWHPRWQDRAFTLGLVLHMPMVLLANSWHQALRLLVFNLLMWGLYLVFLRVPVAGRVVRWDPANPTAVGLVRVCRRLDWLRALSFVPAQAGPAGLAAASASGSDVQALELRELDGSVHTGGTALQRMLVVLPVSYLWAGLLANPLARRWGDAVLARTAPAEPQPPRSRPGPPRVGSPHR